MRIGIFRKPIIAWPLEAQHGSGSENPNKRYPLEGRQGPSDSTSQEPEPTEPTEEPTPTPTPTSTTTPSSTPGSTSTSESSSSRPSSTPSSTPGRQTTTDGPTLTAQPGDSSTPGFTRSTITYTQMYTQTADPSGTPGPDNNGDGGGGFWNNKAAVGSVFGIVGAAGLVILFILITNAIRRARVRKYDRELIEAASTNPRSPGAYRDDDEQPTLPFQTKEESYDMHEFNGQGQGQGQYGHPYSAAGAAGVGAAGGYHNYYNQNDYNQQHYSQGYQYTDGSTSHHSSGAAAGYYQDPRHDPRHASFPGPAGYQQNHSPPPRGHPYASPPPGTYPPADGYNHTADGYNHTADGYNRPADGYNHPESSAYVAPEPSAYGGIEPGYAPDPMPAAAAAYGERGAYAHMQRQDQLNRALSQRSSAPTYQTHQGSSGQDHGQRGLAGIVAAAGLGAHGSSNEKAPLPPPPPPPPPPAEPSHPAPPRTSEEHGNKSEGELPNPFRRRASGETVSAEDWDDEESTGHGGGRVLKVANL